jgi:tRNA threonylcarbamoyladenosine biosynthesis protein TsaE
MEHVLQNAIAYTDRKGRIALSADGDEQQAVIRISDNGSGSPPRTCRACSTASTASAKPACAGEAALGLGLPLTRQFIEAHGGTVDLESVQGKGDDGHPDDPAGIAVIVEDEQATARAGARLAAVAKAGDVITLSGPLGAGKTTLARGFIAALGHSGDVPSPSFAIVQPYEELDPPCGTSTCTAWKTRPSWRSSASTRRPRAFCWSSGRSGRVPDAWPQALRLALEPTDACYRSLTAKVPSAWEDRWPFP